MQLLNNIDNQQIQIILRYVMIHFLAVPIPHITSTFRLKHLFKKITNM